jgi:hypothetical protein
LGSATSGDTTLEELVGSAASRVTSLEELVGSAAVLLSVAIRRRGHPLMWWHCSIPPAETSTRERAVSAVDPTWGKAGKRRGDVGEAIVCCHVALFSLQRA